MATRSHEILLESASAMPGESDEEFAARLAAIAAVMEGAANNSTFARSARRPEGSARSGSTILDATPQRLQAEEAPSRILSSLHFEAPFSSAGGQGPSISRSPFASSAGAPPPVLSEAGGPSSSGGSSSAVTAEVDVCCMLERQPSAPPMPQHGAAGDQSTCVICLSEPPEAGFLHGSSVHRCVCLSCSGKIKVGDRCPMCRVRVEKVLNVF